MLLALSSIRHRFCSVTLVRPVTEPHAGFQSCSCFAFTIATRWWLITSAKHDTTVRRPPSHPMHRYRSAAPNARRLAALLWATCPARAGLHGKAAPAFRALRRSAPCPAGLRQHLRYWLVVAAATIVLDGRPLAGKLATYWSRVSPSAGSYGHRYGAGSRAPRTRRRRGWLRPRSATTPLGRSFCCATHLRCCWQIASAPPPALDPSGCKRRGYALNALAPLLRSGPHGGALPTSYEMTASAFILLLAIRQFHWPENGHVPHNTIFNRK